MGATWPNHSQVLLVFFIYSKPLVSDLSWSKQSRASSWRHRGLIERKCPSYKMSKNKLPWKTFYPHWNTRSWIDQRFISSDQYISWKPQKNHWSRKINCGMVLSSREVWKDDMIIKNLMTSRSAHQKRRFWIGPACETFIEVATSTLWKYDDSASTSRSRFAIDVYVLVAL